jgi:hypothetical protein
MDFAPPCAQGDDPLNCRRCSMGDKSPKAKDKAKKQVVADQNQKKAAAYSKAHPPALSGKKSK